MRFVMDAKDALLLRMRSRKLTEAERRGFHDDVANDPAVQRALERTLADHPQFRRSEREQRDVPGNNG